MTDWEIQPGDLVTMVLYSDGWTRSSTVKEDGTYVGSGAVASGRGEVVHMHRYPRHAEDA